MSKAAEEFLLAELEKALLEAELQLEWCDYLRNFTERFSLEDQIFHYNERIMNLQKSAGDEQTRGQ
jgi:hypothetical protein